MRRKKNKDGNYEVSPREAAEMVRRGELKMGGPLRHSELEGDLGKLARHVYKRVGYLISPTYEQWEVGFLQDSNPDKEILWWVGTSRIIEILKAHSDAEKLSIIRAILGGEITPEIEQAGKEAGENFEDTIQAILDSDDD